ncbi:hypothetical protein NVV78_05080 [Pediococcus ethanolidurans]|uniref:hypothetical protein n=1 Tax=Pediococcus ethanolidurans TaxID=319653 RepID=UPI001C1EC680|nr:hypothetical protein [Pediococcus ethanolidurans]MBU7562903.1 hypothetical protein [Pediococcus ethanolidurans]MCT4398764.1 hypothetical protein [Pediococcus ethanolidurans]MCV3315317.1 hypothetical protein [Pediococcus ethanolidurans]MCV3321950.1 hypothetical protein [Pediococcus ethanolidurans]MCV3323322.1 hypothetical protein [Pediococcus ethanolidurans]
MKTNSIKTTILNSIFAFSPLILALIIYPFLPNKIFVPSSVSGMQQVGAKNNIFVFPMFCIIAWLVCWFFIKINRIRERNYKHIENNQVRSIENYYVWASWGVDLIGFLAVLCQFLIR